MSKHKQAQHIAEDRHAYQDSVKYYRDIKNSLDTAREEGEAMGEAKGRAEEKLLLAHKMKENGYSLAEIAALTELAETEIAAL